MTLEDTIDITMTIKNTSGKKFTQFGLALCYTDADLGRPGNSVWIPPVQAAASISWANTASKTFTWSITPETIIDKPMYQATHTLLIDRLSNVRTLPFRLQLQGTASDSSYLTLVYTLSGVQYIDRYYNPQITLDVWRYPNDESSTLATTIKVELAEGNNASGFTATMYYAQNDRATTESSVFSMDVDRDVLFGVGYSANTGVLPGTFSIDAVYSFLLVVSDGIETASAMCIVDRAFANLHLSGQATGGIAIGKFSAATYGNPLFECAFPIVLSGSKTYGPSSDMPANPVEGQLYFVVE